MTPVILHLFDYFNRAGTELGLCTLAREGFYDGMQPHFLALARGQGDIQPDMAALLGNDRAEFLLDRRDLIAGGKLAPELVAQLIELLAQAIERIKPTILILSLPIANFVGYMAAQRFPDMRVVSFEHNATAGRYQNILAPLLPRCAAVFGDTQETLREARKLYPANCPAFEVPLTILEPGAPRTPQTPKHFKLLSLGRLAPQKNYLELLHALAALTRENIDCSLSILGEGPQRAELETLAQQLGIAEHISLPGFENDSSKLAQQRAAAHIYIQPSLVEGFCLSVAEALAAGLPTVATATGGIRDYGIDGRNMIFINGPSRGDIAAALRHLMNNYATLAPALSAAALETARARFSRAAAHRLWRPVRDWLLAP